VKLRLFYLRDVGNRDVGAKIGDARRDGRRDASKI
jgi:hypothetical protein